MFDRIVTVTNLYSPFNTDSKNTGPNNFIIEVLDLPESQPSRTVGRV